jgi:hypothetical protein
MVKKITPNVISAILRSFSRIRSSMMQSPVETQFGEGRTKGGALAATIFAEAKKPSVVGNAVGAVEKFKEMAPRIVRYLVHAVASASQTYLANLDLSEARPAS